MLDAGAVVEGEPRQERPMVLRVGRHFKISPIERGGVAEVDTLLQRAAGIQYFDRLIVKLAPVARGGEGTAHFQEMRSDEIEGRYRPVLQPFDSSRAAVLHAEEIAQVAFGRERHVGIALRADVRVETLKGDAAVEDAVENSEMIDQRAD